MRSTIDTVLSSTRLWWLSTVASNREAVCRRSEQIARSQVRRMKALAGVLVLMPIGAGVGWWEQDTLKDVHYFRAATEGISLWPEREHALRVGDEFSECKKGCPTMVVIPAGKITMGSPESEGGDDERPQHEVTFAKPFAVAKFDVTFAEWDACVEAGACPRARDNGWGRGDRPVINVSWDDAQVYVAWLKRVTRREYRLLSEAEWEYAARAGTTTAYYWGNDIGEGNANCDGCGSQWDGKQTAPVGSFKPNGFGLHDMAGNVWQWVEDCYHDSYEGAPNDGSAWVFGNCSSRVLRGGSWNYLPWGLRAADRVEGSTDYLESGGGFRLGRTFSARTGANRRR